MIEKLINEKSFPHPVEYIKFIETHSSWVVLTGKFAYKIKKPVNFGFLDYSTLDKRKYYCERELKLNRELTPIYLDVVPVFKNGDNLSFVNGTSIVDYAVKMKEIPQHTIMSNLLEENKVSPDHIERISEIVCDFHKNASTDEEVKKYGEMDTIRFNWNENFSQIEPYMGLTIFRRDHEEIKERILSFMEKEDLFLSRIDGYVKLVHGDLHTGNIFIHNHDIHIFDRIEFNMRFACSDTAADVAFLLMDLEYRNRFDLSNFFLLRYIMRTEDYGMLRLIDFYRSYRAHVRGKVTGFLYSQNKDDRLIETARRYFQFSLNYARRMEEKPSVYVLYGLPGSGKSTMASMLAEHKGAIHIQTDVIRRVITGLDFGTHHYQNFEQGIYSKDISNKVYSTMIEIARKVVDNGKSVVLDGTFSNEEYREMVKEKLPGVKFIRCYVPDSIARERIKKKQNLDTLSDITIELYEKMKNRFTPYREDIMLNCSGNKNENFQRLLNVLKL